MKNRIVDKPGAVQTFRAASAFASAALFVCAPLTPSANA